MPTLAKIQAFSQDAVAQKFADAHAGKFKFVVTVRLNKWFVWNDTTQQWENDITQYVRDCVRTLCRELAPEMCSLEFVLGVEQLASMDRRFAAEWAELGISKTQTKKKQKAVQS